MTRPQYDHFFHRFSGTLLNKKLRYRGEHSASDFGIRRKLILCNFLLMINTNIYILSCTVPSYG